MVIWYNTVMLLFSMLGWWYSRGWFWVAKHALVVRNKRILQFFSVTELLKTLFAPFRQDYIDTERAPIGIKLQALGTNLISRLIGFIIRIVLILCGVLLVGVNTVLGLAIVVVWPLLPFAPLVAGLIALLWVGFIGV